MTEAERIRSYFAELGISAILAQPLGPGDYRVYLGRLSLQIVHNIAKANLPPSGSEAATGITAPPSFTLESALDHPLAGYVILPAVGAAVGAVTHPLQALLHRAMYPTGDHEPHPWKLRHSTLLGARVGLGQAASRQLGHAVRQHLRTLHHRKHAAWRTPVAARLFVEPLVKYSRTTKQPCRRWRSTASGASRQ